MDLVYLKKLLKIFEESNASELVIEEEGIKLKLVKSSVSFPVEQSHYIKVEQPQSIPAINSVVNSTESKTADLSLENLKHTPAFDETANLHTVYSPIVGTFYRSPSPDSGPFVEVGTYITTGKPLCIIEAMKLMNEIECDINGTVEKILVQNAQPVEYNQPLFLIRPE